MGGPYRDDTAALSGRIATLERQVAELEAGFSRYFWEKRATRYGVEPPRAFKRRLQEDVTTTVESLEWLEHRLERLEEVKAKLPVIEDVRLSLPKNAPELESSRTIDQTRAEELLLDPNVVLFRRELERVARSIDLAPLERGGVGGPADVDDLPLFVVCARRAEQGARLWDSTIALGTSVPVGIESVEIGVVESSSRPMATGDRTFDGLFSYRGSGRTARELANETVRQCLFEIAKHDVPTIRIDKSEAWLEWCAEPNRRSFEAAFTVLRATRQLEPPRLMR